MDGVLGGRTSAARSARVRHRSREAEMRRMTIRTAACDVGRIRIGGMRPSRSAVTRWESGADDHHPHPSPPPLAPTHLLPPTPRHHAHRLLPSCPPSPPWQLLSPPRQLLRPPRRVVGLEFGEIGSWCGAGVAMRRGSACRDVEMSLRPRGRDDRTSTAAKAGLNPTIFPAAC